jgi:hypothetical protein
MNTFFNSELLIVNYNDREKVLEPGTILVDAYQLVSIHKWPFLPCSLPSLLKEKNMPFMMDWLAGLPKTNNMGGLLSFFRGINCSEV